VGRPLIYLDANVVIRLVEGDAATRASKEAHRMFTRYQPRPLGFLGVESVGGHRLKVYAIWYGDKSFDPGRFRGGWELAKPALPQPNAAAGRPGVGFAILHQGVTSDNFILCWWDGHIDLPTRVYVGGPEGWRPAAGGESFCVYDLRVIWWEREAYVTTVLAGRQAGVEAYLATVAEGYA
jgi:hypothetical protein